MFLSMRSFTAFRRAGLLLPVAAAFAAGLSAGALIVPVNAGPEPVGAFPGEVATGSPSGNATKQNKTPTHTVVRAGHPAKVLRVIDGDTFEARVRIWPGMDVTTRVRLRGIDAPELHARCADERAGALAARDALTRLLDEGGVGVSDIGQDKYGGRVDATVSTAATRDVSQALLAGGYARAYRGGRRRSWCG